jgi:hypothetical protein
MTISAASGSGSPARAAISRNEAKGESGMAQAEESRQAVEVKRMTA